MAVELRPASSEAYAVMERAKKLYHDDLVKAEVRVCVLFAFRGDDDESEEPVLKHHGYPAAAIFKVTPYEQRVQGNADCSIRVDESQWVAFTEDERLALMDHELQHALLVLDPEGNVKPDRCGRPVLKCRPHDLVVGGFESVVRRHKANAIETKHIREIFATYRQATFMWTDDAAPADQPPTASEVLRSAKGVASGTVPFPGSRDHSGSDYQSPDET